MPELSFVIAAHNESGSLPTLLSEIRAVAAVIGRPHEIVMVDDGSDDGSAQWLRAQASEAKDLVVVCHERNGGQSVAMATGLEKSRGAIIITLDADLQNNPADAAVLVEALADCDLACGVRTGRKDRWAKRVGSRFANWIRRLALRDQFRDVGCTLKAWRRPVASTIPKFVGFHRYIPILARAEGFTVVEIAVSHRGRQYGSTHYGNLGRAVRGIFDLIGVAWLLRRRRAFGRTRPPARVSTRKAVP